MRFLPLVLKHLRRTWVRTGSTAVAMALCVFLFCTLVSVVAVLQRFVSGRSPSRLVTRNAVSLMLPVPLSHADQIRAVPGVKRAAVSFIFGGLLPSRRRDGAPDPEGAPELSRYFPNAVVQAEPYFAMYPEYVVAPDHLRAFLADRRGCVMGRQLADKFGWRPGDRFHLESFVPAFRKPSGPFEFVLRGYIGTDRSQYPDTETDIMFFHWEYLAESLPRLRPLAYTVEIEDPGRAADLSAAIDAVFENSSHPTFTETEKTFAGTLMSVAGDMAAVVEAIGLAVCFTILIVTGNTMSMAVRERRTEIAVLKTLGFTSGQVLSLVVVESVVLGALGGLLGIAASACAVWFFSQSGRTFLGVASVELRPGVALLGLGAAMSLGLVSGLLPAWGAYRARITDMLRAT